MTQTLTLESTNYSDANEIMALIREDRELLVALNPKGTRKLTVTAQKVQIDHIAEKLEGILTTARIEGYEITIENASEAVSKIDEIEKINAELKEADIMKPMDRLKWLVVNRPHMPVSRAAAIIVTNAGA